MSDDRRHPVPEQHIKIQYREPVRPGSGRAEGEASTSARFAVDVPGYPPFVYTVNSNYTVDRVLENPLGMRLEERGGTDVLVYGNGQTLPLSRDMNRAIEWAGKSHLSSFFNTRLDREQPNGELRAGVSDAIVRRSDGGFSVVDMDLPQGAPNNSIHISAAGRGQPNGR